MTIVGKELIDYESKKTGKQVRGIKLYCTDDKNERIIGLFVETFFINEKSDVYEDVVDIPINSEINIVYNRYGSVSDIELLKK